MITITTSSTIKELEGILELQKQNLKQDLTPEQIKAQGFVTVSHSLDDLEKMHRYEPNIIAKDGDTVAAYVLGMTKQSKTIFQGWLKCTKASMTFYTGENLCLIIIIL